MTLATHHLPGITLQGSYVSFPSKPLPSRYLTLKRCEMKCHVIALGKVDRCLSQKQHISVKSRVPRSSLLVSKSVRISSFKGTPQIDESSSRTHGSKVSSNLLRLSFVPKDGNRNMMGSPKAHDVPVSYTPEANEVASSPAFQKLFRKWLSILRTRPPEPLVDNVSGQVVSRSEAFESETRIEEKSPLSKALLTHFWALDSSIILPMMIFIPLYLGVHVTYGREVSRELTPLWVIGPLIVALYVKLFRGLWALYVITFKQMVNVVKSLPAYYLLARKYVAHGKLKHGVQAHVWHLVTNIRNLVYKELSERRIGEFRGWLLEKYLDFVESIWPYYSRTVRFLKRANFI